VPIPSGLDWDDRLAPYTHPTKGPGHYFLCRREGHKDRKRKHIEFVLGTKTDAREARNAHDTAHHNTLYRVAGLAPEKNATLASIFSDFFAHVELLEVEGTSDPETTRFYDGMIRGYLRPGFAALGIRTVRELDQSSLSDFVRWARTHRPKQKGASMAKAITALKTMIRWRGFGSIADDLKTPTKEIKAERREKRDLDSATVRRLISAMDEGSIEEAIAYLKARTGCRDVEIFKAVRETFDLKVGTFAPILKNKGRGKKKRHVYALTSDVIAKVRPFVMAARPGGYVFERAPGQHVTREWLRPRIRTASRRAGIVKTKTDFNFIGRGKKGKKYYSYQIGAIDSIAPIRAEIATVVTERTSIKEAAANLGWQDEETMTRWYLKDRITAEQLAERRKVAEIIADAMPLTLR
jgi:integrase